MAAVSTDTEDSKNRNTETTREEPAAACGEDGSELVISVQPASGGAGAGGGGGRAALPVPAGWVRAAEGAQEGAAPRGQFIPVTGLDFLIGVDALLLHQTVDSVGSSSAIESENRYTVRVGGDALYIGSAVSSSLQRCVCGAGRALALTLHDGTRQEALRMHRRLAAASCLCPCRLQEMRVWCPGGGGGAGLSEFVGRVQQQWAWMVPLFLVRDAADDLLFVLEGPAALCAGAHLKRAHFKILSADSLREEGQIVHSWTRELVNYTTAVQLPRRAVQPRHKALLLAAAFLLEFTYFEKTNLRNCSCCNCF